MSASELQVAGTVQRKMCQHQCAGNCDEDTVEVATETSVVIDDGDCADVAHGADGGADGDDVGTDAGKWFDNRRIYEMCCRSVRS